ncbi:MAG TPA: sigma-70 family RNA polymerase sigma factor [Chthonomonadaceae bacterium]|nr:sigma-70 family RNA polymerase sigma factor [Chthonomonadaceae bacterium]
MAKRQYHYPKTPDEELVLATLLGNLDAFDELVRRFRGAVVLVAAQTLGSRAAAEDVAQEAFLLAFKALPQLQNPSRFASWLCAITRHRARRVGAKEGRSETYEPSKLDQLILTHSRELSVNPAEEFDHKLERARIPEAMELLPTEYRIALQLRYYEDWSIARIADFLALPITTVKWRLHHGRTLMRRYLTDNKETFHEQERYGYSPLPATVA